VTVTPLAGSGPVGGGVVLPYGAAANTATMTAIPAPNINRLRGSVCQDFAIAYCMPSSV